MKGILLIVRYIYWTLVGHFVLWLYDAAERLAIWYWEQEIPKSLVVVKFPQKPKEQCIFNRETCPYAHVLDDDPVWDDDISARQASLPDDKS